jgi:hypothetical protein
MTLRPANCVAGMHGASRTTLLAAEHAFARIDFRSRIKGMKIGKPLREIYVEPLELPEPLRSPEQTPEPEPQPEPQKVSARAKVPA